MHELAREIRRLRGGDVGRMVKARLAEFRRCGRGGSRILFKEMCFCILTANYTAERAMAIQEAVGGGFVTLTERRLADKLRKLGYRFPNTRASYIAAARKHIKGLDGRIKSSCSGTELRDWLVKNVKGLGMKEASHFLRNVGFEDLAIIDFHIIDVLVRHRLIRRPKTLTRSRYMEIEGVLRGLADELGMSLAELDLYLWHMETGKVLK